MKDCMQMLARIDREKLMGTDAESPARHYEHLICDKNEGKPAYFIPGQSQLPPAGASTWQFI